MKRFRRALLEIWAILPLAAVVGFMGPFGTYLMGDFMMRTGRWWGLLMGVYVVVRPTMLCWRWVSRATGLPRSSVMLWGVILSSFPLAMIWDVLGPDEIRNLGGYSGLLPFTFLCSLAILFVAGWAERADNYLLRYYNMNLVRHPAHMPSADHLAQPASGGATGPISIAATSARPRLHARLSPQFEGDILALESEDHYVRVHGARQSELLLLRLRDAIAEMDDVPGEQTHRSWWVAQRAVANVTGTGRNREIRLASGKSVPVARDSVDRLQRSGFLTPSTVAG